MVLFNYGFNLNSNPDQLELAKAYSNECRNKVYFYLNSGKIDSVQFWTYEGLNYLRREKINDPLLMGKQYNFVSYIQGLLGDKIEAINFADSAILSLESMDSLTTDIIYSYQKKGQMYQMLGDFYRANTALEIELHITNQLKVEKSKVLNGLGTNEMHIGNLDKAETYFKLLITNKEAPQKHRVVGHVNLTDLYLNLGKLPQAKVAWKEVQQYIDTVNIEEDPFIPDFLQIKAHLQQIEGHRQQSITTLQKAIELLNKQPLENRKAEKFRCGLVMLLLKENAAEALKECRKSYHYFNNHQEEQKDPFEMVSTHLMASCFYKQYKESKQHSLLDSSLYYCKKAQETSDLLREGFLYRNSKYVLAEYLKSNTELGVDIAHELIEKGRIKAGQEDFFYFLEKGKNQVLLDELNERQRAQLASRGLIEKLYTLELKKMETSDSTERIALSKQIEQTKETLKDSEYSSSVQDKLLRPDIAHLIQLSKQSNVVFLEFGEGMEYPYVMKINNGHFIQKKIALTKDTLSTLIQQHLSNLKNPSVSAKEYAVTAYQLYKLLLKPLAIEQQNIIIIPSEPMAQLPFESLVIEPSATKNFKTLHYALKIWNFSYSFSSTLLQHQQKETKHSFCGLLPVNQEEGDLSSHENLLNTVKNKFQGTSFQRENDFTLSGASKQYDFIHISSHGTFASEDPKQSYFFMPGSDSSKLSITQLYSTPINGNPFMVLNTCETGEGELRSGEGIDNFTRAFFYSGASGVVESGWKINAKQTANIFSHFYNKLWEDSDTKTALRAAQLIYLKDQRTDNHFAHPYYWAGFRHFGATATLEKPTSAFPYWLMIATAVVGLILGFVWWSRQKRIY